MTNVVDVYVGRVRRKIGKEGDRIVTLRNVGYRMS
jgi:DNA-binding response OmpR family regulator